MSLDEIGPHVLHGVNANSPAALSRASELKKVALNHLLEASLLGLIGHGRRTLVVLGAAAKEAFGRE